MKDWRRYLPSKKFLILGVCVLVLLVIFFSIRLLIKIKQKEGTVFTNTNTSNKKVTFSDVIEKDTDEDGIKDWEETLWGTNPLKPITFDSPDAKYIEQKKLAGATGEGYNSDGKIIELNETQKIAREIFSTTLGLNQSGAINADSANLIADSVATYIKNYKSGEDYKYEVLKLAKDNSNTTIKKYYTNITDILSKHIKQIDNSIYIVNEATTNDDPGLLKQMDPIIQKNEKTIAVLLKMTVPPDASFMHLKLLNNLNRLNQNEKDMTQLFKNPVVSLAAVNKYQENLINIQTSAQELKAYFNKKSI